MLAVPEAIRWMGGGAARRLAGGDGDEIMRWPWRRARCCARPWESRSHVRRSCSVQWPRVPLPDATAITPPRSPLYLDRLQDRLMEEKSNRSSGDSRPAAPRRLLRISAQLYNSLPQYRALAEALRRCLAMT